MIWILLSAILFLIILSEIQFQWKYRSLKNFPGPIHIPFIGLIFYFYDEKKWLRNTFLLLKRYGSIVRGAVGRQMIILTSELEMIEFFLRTPKLTVKADNYLFLEPWLGRGILIAEGVEWQKTRKMITPAFHFNIMGEQVNIFHTHCDVLLEVLQKDVDSNRPIDVYPKIANFALDVIAETAMGIKTNVQNKANQEYLNAIHFMTSLLLDRSSSIWKRFQVLFQLSPVYQKQLKYVKILNDVSIKVIEERKKVLLKKLEGNTEDSEGKKEKGIFLDILLQSTIDGEPLSNEKIKNEVNNLMFGGHDTTAAAISIMIYALANNKEVQDKVVAELKEIYGDDRDRAVRMQDLNEMRYMDLVIKEVLRFYGVVPVIGRKVIEDVYYNGILIPKDTTIALFLYGLHKSKALYENHNEFIPERFLSTMKPFSYVPFSAGPRNCLGQKYAVNEIKVTFAKLLRHYEFESAGPDHEMVLKPDMVMKPVNGIYVKIKSRCF